jgi:uncharacterized protein (UPF0147 family)
MTTEEKTNYNRMHAMLVKISSDYQTPEDIRESSEEMGLDYDEALEMAYENIQSEA